MEIEVADIGRASRETIESTCRHWGASIVTDGSLPSSGFEIPTAPASGDVFCRQIEEITKALAGARVTVACGLHVHVDARDFRHYDLRRLVFLYAKLESALFATQPTTRRRNSYCTPCGEILAHGLATAQAPKAAKHELMRNVYEQPGAALVDLRGKKGNKYDGARYRALNLHSWVYRGTVECRLHTGSIQAGKIIPWAMLWASLLDYSYKATERDIRALALPTMPEQQAFLAEKIAPTDEVRHYLADRWRQFSGRGEQ